VVWEGRCFGSPLSRSEDLGASALAQLARGASHDGLIERGGTTFACAATMGGGYREYRSDAAMAPDDVGCVVLMRLGEAGDRAAATEAERYVAGPAATGEAADVDLATFLRGGVWYGMPVAEVQGAARIERMAPLPAGSGTGCALALHDGRAVPVIRLQADAPASRDAGGGTALVVICRDRGGRTFGLEVERLGGVLALPGAAIQALPSLRALGDGRAEGLVRGATAGSPMLTVTAADRFAARALPGGATRPAEVPAEPVPARPRAPEAEPPQRRSQTSASASITTPTSSPR
jgi:chemotaxis signal transduction protein